jgi:hypothetical protein
MKLGMSNFAAKRHVPRNGYSYFTGTNDELLELVKANWDKRIPGAGRDNLDKVVLVPVPPTLFLSATAIIHNNMVLNARFFRRQEFEDPFIKVSATGDYSPPNVVQIVCYSAGTLLENDGSRSGDFDWEIVAIIASDVPNEPMHPLVMARNFLQKPGGTFAPYTAEQFAEAIYYWSTRVSIEAD